MQREMVALFREEVPRWSAELTTALAHGDAALLQETAHAAKGAAAQFGGVAVAATARRLEKIGREHDLERAPIVLRELEEEFGRFLAALAAEEAECGTEAVATEVA